MKKRDSVCDDSGIPQRTGKLRRNAPSGKRTRAYYSERFLRRRHASTAVQDSPNANKIAREVLNAHIRDYLLSGRLSQHTERTMAEKERILDKFQWFLDREGYEEIGLSEVQAYLRHVTEGHLEPEGRFGQGKKYAPARRPCTPNTYRYHYAVLRAFFAWLLTKRKISETPFNQLDRPQISQDQVQPFTDAQIEALLREAKRGFSPRRDVAVILFLLDTGVRAEELCSLKIGDIDEQARSAQVMGKGRKKRLVYFGSRAGRALMQHFNEMSGAFGSECLAPHAPVFPSDRGTRAGERLTAHGLHQLVARLGERAGLSGVRCSPHTFRHTFAINFLRDGGNQSSLMRLLGHTSLTMTERYLALANADLEEQHRRHSPADRLGNRRRG